MKNLLDGGRPTRDGPCHLGAPCIMDKDGNLVEAGTDAWKI